MGKMRAENGASPGKCNQRLGPAENGWFCFDPYPGVNKGTKGNQELLNKGTKGKSLKFGRLVLPWVSWAETVKTMNGMLPLSLGRAESCFKRRPVSLEEPQKGKFGNQNDQGEDEITRILTNRQWQNKRDDLPLIG